MLQINPKKFRPIKNKTIPNPMRPKFRNKAQSNIYFLSQRKVTGEKKVKFKKNLKFISILSLLFIGGYFLAFGRIHRLLGLFSLRIWGAWSDSPSRPTPMRTDFLQFLHIPSGQPRPADISERHPQPCCTRARVAQG